MHTRVCNVDMLKSVWGTPMLDIDPSSSACARCSIDLDDLIGKAEEALDEK